MDDLDKLKLKREKQREYAKAHYWRKKMVRDQDRPASQPTLPKFCGVKWKRKVKMNVGLG